MVHFTLTPIFDTKHTFAAFPIRRYLPFYANLQEHDIGESLKDRTCSQHSVPWQTARSWSSRGGFPHSIINSLFQLKISLRFLFVPIWEIFCITERGGHGQEATSAQQIMEWRSLWFWYRGSWQCEKWEYWLNRQLAHEGLRFCCTLCISCSQN